MSKINHYVSKADKRKKRISSKITGTALRPRVTVKRANKYLYIQLINDIDEVTLMSSSDVKIRKELKKSENLTKTQSAIKATQLLVEKMKKAKITKVVFDRGQYKYHGRVKAVAETLREGGIEV